MGYSGVRQEFFRVIKSRKEMGSLAYSYLTILQVFTRLLRIAVVASLGVFAVGLVVLPSLAGDDLRLKLAEILKVTIEGRNSDLFLW